MTASKMPRFTRYLYEFHQVKYSLQECILEKKREEALFWAYELYHSGFKEEVWEQIIHLYLLYYLEMNPKFKTRLEKFYKEWRETCDTCLIGTVVGTLSVWEWDVDSENQSQKKNKQFIILYKEDRHNTVAPIKPARNNLKQVSLYPVHSLFPTDEPFPNYSEMVRNAYFGPNWLYYCIDTPIWEVRIREGGGKPVNGSIEFESDDLLEDFYEIWGFEPDEQTAEMHNMHGVDYRFAMTDAESTAAHL